MVLVGSSPTPSKRRSTQINESVKVVVVVVRWAHGETVNTGSSKVPHSEFDSRCAYGSGDAGSNPAL